MEKVFKGKIKHNVFFAVCTDEKKWVLISALMCAFVFVPVAFLEEDAEIPLILLLTFGVLLFSYFYGKWYAQRMKCWDKQGYETMSVFPQSGYLKLDEQRMVFLKDIEYISFKECDDYLPPLPKSYDLVNACLEMHLKDQSVIIFYVQQISKICAMSKYFRKLGIEVRADDFEKNPMYFFQAHYAWFLLLIIGSFVTMAILKFVVFNYK